MPIYEVNITDANKVRVEADTPEQARAIVREQIQSVNRARDGKLAALPGIEELLFDYETGVKDVDLRYKLGTAENPRERENVAEKILGEDGFTYTSDLQLAATPAGLLKLGIKPEYLTLKDGSRVGKNVVIDERSFGFNKYDFADMSGVVGPILGAIAFLTPQARLIGGVTRLMKFFNGGDRTSRILASGIGTAAGKGVEEAIEVEQGLQLQNKQEIADLLKFEFGLGALGQGIGEGLGVGYGMLLGKQPPHDNIRLLRQAIQGRNLDDIMKLDASLGKEATEKQIVDAIKAGKVTIFQERGLPSQANLGRSLVGRGQSTAELVFGSKRTEETKKYLTRSIAELFGRLNKEKIDGDDLAEIIKNYGERTFMTSAQKSELDDLVRDRIAALNNSEIDSIQSVEKLFDDLIKDLTDQRIYGPGGILPEKIDPGDTGQVIKEALFEARSGLRKQQFEKFQQADTALRSIRPQILGDINENVFKKASDDIKATLNKFENERLGFIFGADDKEAGANAIQLLKGIQENLAAKSATLAKNLKEGKPLEADSLNLVQIRNTLSDLKALTASFTRESPLKKVVNEVTEILGFGDELTGGSNRPGLLGILGDAEQLAVKTKISPADAKQLGSAIHLLKSANKFSRDVLENFDDKIIQSATLSNAKYGTLSPDEAYSKIFKGGNREQLEDMFKAVKMYDDYIKDVGPKGFKADNELKLRNSLKKKLISEAFYDAYDYSTNTIDFSKFAAIFTRFDAKSPGKLRALFGDETVSGFNSDNFLAALRQINEVKPNLKPGDIEELILNLETSERGLTKISSGKSFIEGLRNIAKAKSETARFEGNAIISRLPEATTEEVVGKIFTPQGASNIAEVKALLGPEKFVAIQNNAMNKILQRAVDFDGITKQGDIVKLFQADKFNNILKSYGDETLFEMFGTEVAQGLKNFGKTMELLTRKEVGRGGAAGTLVAAGIAINAFNPAVWGTLIGLGVLRSAFQNPTILKLMARTDKSAVVQLIEIFQRALLIGGVRQTGLAVSGVAEDISEEVEEQLDATTLDDQATGILGQGAAQIQNLIPTGRQQLPLPVGQVDLPEIDPVDILGQDALPTLERERQLGFGPILRT